MHLRSIDIRGRRIQDDTNPVQCSPLRAGRGYTSFGCRFLRFLDSFAAFYADSIQGFCACALRHLHIAAINPVSCITLHQYFRMMTTAYVLWLPTSLVCNIFRFPDHYYYTSQVVQVYPRLRAHRRWTTPLCRIAYTAAGADVLLLPPSRAHLPSRTLTSGFYLRSVPTVSPPSQSSATFWACC